MQNSGYPGYALRCDCIGHLTQRQVSGHQRDAQPARGKHHHDLLGVGQVCQKFGVARKRDAAFVDHAFVHRRGDHACKIACNTAKGCTGQGLQYERGVGFVQCACGDRGIERRVPDIEAACRCRLVGPVVRADGQQTDSHAQLRGPLMEQIAAGNGNQGMWLALRGEKQAQVGTYACRFAGCQCKTLCFHCAGSALSAWLVAPGSLIST